MQVFGRLSFWITIYLNRRALLDTLLGNSLCTAEQFEAFLIGFSQASPRFQLVETAAGKDVLDAKIKGEMVGPPAGRLMGKPFPDRIPPHFHAFPSNAPRFYRRLVHSAPPFTFRSDNQMYICYRWS